MSFLDIILICAILGRKWIPPIAGVIWVWYHGTEALGIGWLGGTLIAIIAGYVGVLMRIVVSDFWADWKERKKP